MNRLLILMLLTLAIFTSCNSDKDIDGSRSNIKISTSIHGVTRALKTSFEGGDAISVYAYAAGDINKLYIKNSINTYSDESWSGEPELKWVYDRENYDFLAVYPTRNITDFVDTDFTLQKEMVKNDLLVATNKNVSYSQVEDVRLDFEHIMSKVMIHLSYRDHFVKEPIIEKVLMRVKADARINFLTKEVIAKGEVVDVELERENNNQYVGIAAPQNIEEGSQLILIYIKGDEKPYLFTTTSEVSLEAKKQRTIHLLLGSDNIIVFKNSTINPWGDSDTVDEEINRPEDDAIINGPWGDGAEDILTPEKESEVALDIKNSIIPEQMQLDIQNRILAMPYNGGRAEICFSGNFDKDVLIEIPDSRVTVVSASNTKFQNSRLIITAHQPLGEKEYRVKIKVSNALYPDIKSTDLTIKIPDSSMPTVIMGGLEWMAFNGCGRSEELYMLGTNMTVRDAYRVNWKKYAALGMWGDRPKPPTKVFIYPWELVSSANSIGGTVIGTGVMRWEESSTSIPCPAGWRLPTIAEISAIWPTHGAAQNSTYERNGVTYTTSFVHSGSSDVVADDGKTTIATNLFILSDGTNELIFPVTGYRTVNTNVIAEFPGRDFYLWTTTKDAAKPPVAEFNKVSVVGVSLGKIHNITTAGQLSAARPEAYNGVRCVRNIQKNK